MNRVLVPLDVSDASGSVIRFVFPFAKKHGLHHIDFIHAEEEEDSDIFGDLFPRDEDKHDDMRLFVEKEIAFISSNGVTYNVLDLRGDIEEEILERTGRMHYDLVVIGYHILSKIDGYITRTIGKGILDQVPCSMLVYKTHKTRWMV